ncbi:hypothetical protein TIFTF001_043947 [Ficus carica]|uniref:Uncharacterized protein n=1 Tax=Ficus carica TaxID=3494 RepID=A0AA87YYL5_FICCA|nr:hypothetical protein TIFTF001_043947 [Ficus carica]
MAGMGSSGRFGSSWNNGSAIPALSIGTTWSSSGATAYIIWATISASMIKFIISSNVIPTIGSGTKGLTLGGNPSRRRSNTCSNGLPKSRQM